MASLVAEPLFVEITNMGKQVIIVLFDVSGSVLSKFKFTSYTVIDIMVMTLFRKLRSKDIKIFKTIFFGSKNDVKMPKGYIADETIFIVSQEEEFSRIAKSHADRYNLTCPHIAIQNIPSNWLTTKLSNTTIELYIVGDGELFDGNTNKYNVKREFSCVIKMFLNNNPMVRIGFHAIDVNNTTVSENTAGVDMYESLKDAKLTSRVSTFHVFNSHEPSDEIELVTNSIVPNGYIGYDKKMFPVTRESEFFNYLSLQIQNCKDETIYSIVRHSSVAVGNIIKSKGLSINLANMLMFGYSHLFKQFKCDDPTIDIVSEDLIQSFNKSVHNTIHNQTDFSTTFCTDRKKFFEEANNLLCKNVKDAIGNNSLHGYTFILENKIFKLFMSEVTAPLTPTLPYACFKDSKGTIAPILPETRRTGKMTDQCMRQYVRTAMNKMYGFSVQSEQAKFAPLVTMVMVYMSDLPSELKKTFIDTSVCMLQKTLTGINVTELDHFRKGNVHSSKNWVSDLQEVIEVITNTKIPALAIWFAICNILDETLGDTILSKNQYIYVKSVVTNPSLWKSYIESLPKVEFIVIESENLEFVCSFTHENTSSGGYAIAPHKWNNSDSTHICSINTVMTPDEEFMYLLIQSDHFNCPMCRARLHKNTLRFVQKSDCGIHLPINRVAPMPVVSTSFILTPPISQVIPTPVSSDSEKNSVIVLKGPVGCGKTTLTKKIVSMLSSKGHIHVVSNDVQCVKLIRQGENPKTVASMASKIVSQELRNFIGLKGNKIVIVDICNEKHKDGTVFGVPLSVDKWKYTHMYVNVNPTTISPKMLVNYFAWCLVHVLSRTEQGMGDDYWLNPESAGFDICKKVLVDKSNALFQGKCKMPPFTKDNAMEVIGPMAKLYEDYLKTNYNQDEEIKACLDLL
jgi:hypothetical protein